MRPVLLLTALLLGGCLGTAPGPGAARAADPAPAKPTSGKPPGEAPGTEPTPLPKPAPPPGKATPPPSGEPAPAGAATQKRPLPRPQKEAQVASKANGDSVVATKRDSDEETGRRLWNRSCWQCHGEVGAGDGPAAAALVGGVPSLAGKVSPSGYDALVKVILEGRGRMPAYVEDLDKHDSRRILVYLEGRMSGRVGATPAKAKDDGKGAEEN